MAIDFQQTDTGGANTSSSNNCATGSAGFTSQLTEVGGVAGSTEISHGMPASSVRQVIAYDVTVEAGINWEAGDWTVRINITTSNMNIELRDIYICRRNSSNENQQTIGSLTGINEILSSTGVKTYTVSGSTSTPNAGDRIFVIGVLVNTNSMQSQTIGFTPSEIISSPFTASTVHNLDLNISEQSNTELTLEKIHQLSCKVDSTSGTNTELSRSRIFDCNINSNSDSTLVLSGESFLSLISSGISSVDIINLERFRLLDLDINGQSFITQDLNVEFTGSVGFSSPFWFLYKSIGAVPLVAGQTQELTCNINSASDVNLELGKSRPLSIEIESDSDVNCDLVRTRGLICDINQSESNSVLSLQLDIFLSNTIDEKSDVSLDLATTKALSCNIDSDSDISADLQVDVDLSLEISGQSSINSDIIITSQQDLSIQIDGLSSTSSDLELDIFLDIDSSSQSEIECSLEVTRLLELNILAISSITSSIEVEIPLVIDISSISQIESDLITQSQKEISTRTDTFSLVNLELNVIRPLSFNIGSQSEVNFVCPYKQISTTISAQSSVTCDLEVTTTVPLSCNINSSSDIKSDIELDIPLLVEINANSEVSNDLSTTAEEDLSIRIAGQSSTKTDVQLDIPLELSSDGLSDTRLSLGLIRSLDIKIEEISETRSSLQLSIPLSFEINATSDTNCEIVTEPVTFLDIRIVAQNNISVNIELDIPLDIRNICISRVKSELYRNRPLDVIIEENSLSDLSLDLDILLSSRIDAITSIVASLASEATIPVGCSVRGQSGGSSTLGLVKQLLNNVTSQSSVDFACPYNQISTSVSSKINVFCDLTIQGLQTLSCNIDGQSDILGDLNVTSAFIDLDLDISSLSDIDANLRFLTFKKNPFEATRYIEKLLEQTLER